MNAQEFIDSVTNDAGLQQKLMGADSQESYFEIAKENGFTGDFETLKSAIEEIAKNQNILLDEDLDEMTLKKVAGGREWGTEAMMLCA